MLIGCLRIHERERRSSELTIGYLLKKSVSCLRDEAVHWDFRWLLWSPTDTRTTTRSQRLKRCERQVRSLQPSPHRFSGAIRFPKCQCVPERESLWLAGITILTLGIGDHINREEIVRISGKDELAFQVRDLPNLTGDPFWSNRSLSGIGSKASRCIFSLTASESPQGRSAWAFRRWLQEPLTRRALRIRKR